MDSEYSPPTSSPPIDRLPSASPAAPPADTLRAGRRRLVLVETRLALSASAAADLVLDALWPVADAYASIGPSGETTGWGSLFDQAADVRDRFALTGQGQTVAVIDSGIAWDHVALGGGFGPGYRVVGGWDFAEDDADPYDDPPAGFHGTHVAGILGGESPEYDFAGIATGVDLVALRVFDAQGYGSFDWLEQALRWVYDNRDAFEHPITAVNMSLGAILPEGALTRVMAQLEDELQLLASESIFVVAAAGNQFDPAHGDRLAYPASSSHVVAVGAGDASGLSGFSQRSDEILVAPGVQIRSSVPDHVFGWDGEVNDFASASGTSMAAPQVTGAAVLVRQAMEQVGQVATPESILEHLRLTADMGTDPVTGVSFHAINLTRAIDTLMIDSGGAAGGEGESGSSADPAAPAVTLGSVQRLEVEMAAGVWHGLTAARDGILSVVVDRAEPVQVTAMTPEGTVLWSGAAPESGQLDLAVRGGQEVVLSVDGPAGESIAVQLANLVAVDGGRLTLAPDAAGDRVTLDVSSGWDLSLGAFRYRFDAGEITAARLDGGPGADSLTIHGSAASEKLLLRGAQGGEFTRAGLHVELVGFQQVVFHGGGGADRAYLYGTAGNDTLEAWPGQATLRGPGYHHQVAGMQRIFAYGMDGGEDVAFLHDSIGNDHLVVRPQFTSFRGDDFFNLAYGFERVYAYATAGGHNSAELYDSPGDDRMTASPAAAWISGPGYYAQARHFDQVVGYSTAGGNDLATLYAPDAAGRWHRSGELVQLDSGDQGLRAARGFAQVETYVAGTQVEIAAQGLPSAHEPLSAQEMPFAQRPGAMHAGSVALSVESQSALAAPIDVPDAAAPQSISAGISPGVPLPTSLPIEFAPAPEPEPSRTSSPVTRSDDLLWAVNRLRPDAEAIAGMLVAGPGQPESERLQRELLGWWLAEEESAERGA